MKKLLFPILSIAVMLLLYSCGPSKYSLKYQQIDENISTDNLKAAEVICREIIASDPKNAQAYYYLGIIDVNRKDFESAYRNFTFSRKIKKVSGVKFQLANVNYELGKLQSSKAYLDSLGASPSGKNDNSQLLGKLLTKKASADSAFQEGMEFYIADKYYSAWKSFKVSFNLNSEDKETEYYKNMAEGLHLYYKKGIDQYWDAIVAFGNAAVLKPERGEPHYLIGICYEKKDKDDFENSIASFRKALELEMSDSYRKKAESRLANQLDRKKKLDAFWGR